MIEYLRSFSAEGQKIILGTIIFVCAFIVSRTIRWLINRSFLKTAKKSIGDITRIKFFKNAISFMIWLVAFGVFISLIPELKALAITLFASAGILLAILGFAAQEAFSNIISGIFIVIFRPFRVGDLIKVETLYYGFVEDITLRHTVILNFENKRVIIPNSKISSSTIINDSIQEEDVCKFIEIGISYDSDLDLAIKILQEEGEKHPLSFDRRTAKEKKEGEDYIEVRVLGFEESSVQLRAYVWSKDPVLVFRMHSDINKAVKKRFDKEGIEIPFPHRTVVFKNPLETSQH